MSARGLGVLAAVLIGVGAALLVWRPDWNVPWAMMALGVGLGAQRWLSWKHVLIVAVVLFALYLVIQPRSRSVEEWALTGSALGLAGSAGIGRGQKRRAKR